MRSTALDLSSSPPGRMSSTATKRQLSSTAGNPQSPTSTQIPTRQVLHDVGSKATRRRNYHINHTRKDPSPTKECGSAAVLFVRREIPTSIAAKPGWRGHDRQPRSLEEALSTTLKARSITIRSALAAAPLFPHGSMKLLR